MWKCKKCGEEIEDSFDTCWNCGTSSEGNQSQDAEVFNEIKQEIEAKKVPVDHEEIKNEIAVEKGWWRAGILWAPFIIFIGYVLVDMSHSSFMTFLGSVLIIIGVAEGVIVILSYFTSSHFFKLLDSLFYILLSIFGIIFLIMGENVLITLFITAGCIYFGVDSYMKYKDLKKITTKNQE